ncbi:MAG TPA: DUF5317 family protein [Acidimicrobiales bacterium]|jgi:hypothetical protein|nr:DUF5317 family protein [Acidimicrobiales bacterium]
MLYVTGLALVAGAVVGLAFGGRPRFIAQHRLHQWWLVVVGFGLQVVADRVHQISVGTGLVLVGSVALLAFAALNPTLVGIGVVALGVASNALVIGLNNGMPVHPPAVVAAHIAAADQLPVLNYGSRHREERPGDKLRLLDDRIPLAPFREVLSIGDLILAVGVAVTVSHLLRPRPLHARR